MIIANEKALISFGDVIKKINDASPRLQQLTEEITALKLQSGAPAREVATASQLVTLTQRLGKSANSMVAGTVANAEVALMLGRDINQFRDLTQALLSGSDALRVAATNDSETRARLQELTRVYAEFQASIAGAIGGLQAIVQSKEAELAILRDSEHLRQQVSELGSLYNKEQATRKVNLFILGVFAIGLLLCAFAIVKVLLEDTRKRAAEAEIQRMQAERLEQEAKRTNESEPGRHSAADERTAGGCGRRPDGAGDGVRRHHRRHRRFGQLHGRGTARPGRSHQQHRRAGQHGVDRRARHRDAAADRIRGSSRRRSRTPATRC